MPITRSGSGIAPGTIAHFAANSTPAGWLKANGATVSRTTYAALFLAIGTTYGAGDGSTTFALPDLRGEFLRGFDDGRGVDTGRAIGSAQLDQMQGHNHQIPANGTGAAAPQVTGSGTGAYSTNGVYTDQGANGTPRVGPETRPRNVAALACIKF